MLLEESRSVSIHGHERISEVIGRGDKGTMEGVIDYTWWGRAEELGRCGNKIAERGTKSWRTHVRSSHYHWIKSVARPPGWIRFPRYVIQLCSGSVHDWTLQPDPHVFSMRPHCALHLVMLIFPMFICLHTTEASQFYHPYRCVMKSYSLPWNGTSDNLLITLMLIVLVLNFWCVCPCKKRACNLVPFQRFRLLFWLVVAFHTILVCVLEVWKRAVISIPCLHGGWKQSYSWIPKTKQIFTVEEAWLKFLVFWTMVAGRSRQPWCKCMISH